METLRIARTFLPLVVFAVSGAALARAQAKPAAAASPAPLIGGEHFVKRVVTDAQQGGIPAATLYLPESWHLDSKIEWHYDWTENPVQFSAHAENPANGEAFTAFPMLKLEWIEIPPNMRQYVKNQPHPGERMPMGAISLDPRPPLQTLGLYIKQIRGSMPNVKFLGKQDLPDLAKSLGLDPQPNQHGVAIKIGYDLDGKPVEEAFYAVYYLSQGANTGVNAGQIKQTNWGLQALQSFRAPAGTLDKRMTVFAAIAKSLHPTPQWTQRARAIDAQLVAMFNQKLKQGYDQLRAAKAIADEAMKNEAAFNQSINAQMASMRDSGGGSDGSGGGRSVQDKWDDLFRGVDTTVDPSTGTSQHSYMEQYHWTDGFGNYRNSNDPNYDPGKDEAGNWQLMPLAQ